MTENNVNTWAENIAALPDKQFFNIMRLYLGEIKTPYNKQRLAAQLASFIRKPENLESIIAYLDAFDIRILTAISLISNVTQENLIDFFSNNYSLAEVVTGLGSLKERLVIYSVKDEDSRKELLFINPLLLESINPFLDISLLFPKENITSFSTDDVFILSPNFLAALIAYLKMHNVLCKADGTLKKNDINHFEEIFPGKTACIQALITAFINLSLAIEEPKALRIDRNRMEAFAQLPFTQQCALLCAASVSHFSREGLRKEAQLLLDCLNSIPESGYTTQTILWLAFLAGSYTNDGSAMARQGRFSQMLQAARAASFSTATDNGTNAALLDRMIDSAISFGLLQKIGTNEEGTPLYIRGKFDEFSVPADNGQLPKVLNLNATFTVSVMPGLPMSALLPLTDFLDIKKFGVVTEFEITKNSLSLGFDAGFTPETVFAEIEKLSYYELPNNLKINVQEWYSSYASAVLYQGYILKVTDNNIKLAENNPNIKKYIKEKLAEGIYLLNIPVDSNISFFKDESGLDFLGNVKTYSPGTTEISFPILKSGQSIQILDKYTQKSYNQISISKANDLIQELKEALKSKETDEHKKECLEHRINNRLILNKEQLAIAAIRSEILEAEGMDFSGKCHLIDTAIKEDDKLELQFPNKNGSGFFTIVGKPLVMTKQVSEAILRFQIEPDHNIENFLVSRITHIKRLRF